MRKELRDILTPRVDCSRGAPMGRAAQSGYEDKSGEWVELQVLPDAAPFMLAQIPLDRGGYDPGGAYWGLRKLRLYGYVGPLTDIRGFVDAKSRDEAKAKVRAIHPNARFYR